MNDEERANQVDGSGQVTVIDESVAPVESSALATRAVHAGLAPDPLTGAVVQPIYQTSTFVQPEPGVLRTDFEYARSGIPNRSALETQLAALEGARYGFAFASGLAAEDTVIRAALGPGAVLVVGADAYGGTLRLFRSVHARWGITVRVVDLDDLGQVTTALAAGDSARTADGGETAIAPAILWVETPSNPWMRVHDVSALAAVAHQYGALLVADNTFASPALFQPMAAGADVVVHSTTKYIGGHSDVLGGAVLCNDALLAQQVGFLQRAVGAVAAPMDCWLTSRGLKTLPLRMRQHCVNAQRIAEFLADHPGIGQVYYPGISSHPDHELASATMRGFGGMVSCRIAAGELAARRVAGATRIFRLAESLGGVESLICHPATMTHASLVGTPEEIPGDLLRLSVGIEDVDDLVADLAHALS